MRGEKVFSKQTAGRSVTWMPLRSNGQHSLLQLQRIQMKQTALESLLYVELLALDSPSVCETGQCLADGPDLLLPFLELSTMFKVCGG